MPGSPRTTLLEELSRLANGGSSYTPLYPPDMAANIWAGTSKLPLVGALNAKNNSRGLGLRGVCNALAGTYGLDDVTALRTMAGVSSPITDSWPASGSPSAPYTVFNPSGQTGTATFSANTLQLSGTGGGYSIGKGVTRTDLTATQSNITGSLTLPNAAEFYSYVMIQTDATFQNGYALNIINGNALLRIVLAGAESNVTGTVADAGLVGNTTWSYRVERGAAGLIRAKWWQGAEPGTWQLSNTDTQWTTPGGYGWQLKAGNVSTTYTQTMANGSVYTKVA